MGDSETAKFRYRNKFTRYLKNQNGRRPRPRRSILEGLEQRMLLNGDLPISEYVVFGRDKVEFQHAVSVQSGTVGSNKDVAIDKLSSVRGLSGGGKLDLKANTTVNGNVVFNGLVDLDKSNLVAGNIDAGKVKLGKGTVVSGNVTSADEIKLEAGAQVHGSSTQFGTPTPYIPVSFPPITTFSWNSTNIKKGDGQTTTLLPGTYGKLELGKNNVLNLSSGQYFFSEVKGDDGLQLNMNLNGGEIAVFVNGNIEFDKQLDVNLLGGDAQDVYFETHHKFELEEDSEWFGTVFAPHDGIEVDKRTAITGALYGTKVQINQQAQLQFMAARRFLDSETETDPPIIVAALANDTGTSQTDGVTTDLSITGTISDESSLAAVTLTVPELSSGPVDFTAQVNATTGEFLLDRSELESLLGVALSDGNYTFQIQAEDEFDNVSAVFTIALTLDTTAPAAPTISAIHQDTGASDTDGVTNDNTLLYSGTAEANASVTLSSSSLGVIGTAVANALGNWTINATSNTLSDGTYVLTATAKDGAGTTSAASTPFTATVDTAAPAAPTIAAIDQDNGPSSTDGLTSDNTLSYSGTAEAFASVTLSGGSLGVIGTAVADGLGHWTIDATSTTLDDGTYVLTAIAKDAAGNTSAVSNSFSVTVETAAPTVPTIAAIHEDTGISDADGVTSDYALSYSGTAEAFTTVTLSESTLGIIGAVEADSLGQWTINAPNLGLTDGSYVFTAVARDAAGNSSGASNSFTVIIDTAAPAAPTIVVIDQDTGRSASDRVTNDTVLSYSGTAEAHADVTLSESSLGIIGTTTADSFGQWTINASNITLSDGVYVLTASAQDTAGNTSAASAPFTVTVDTVPAAPTISAIQEDRGASAADGVTNDNTLTYSGSAEAHASVTLSESGLGFIGTTVADSNGNWTLDATSLILDDGTYVLTATAEDVAGNSIAGSPFTVTVDTSVPAIPAALDLVAASDRGLSDSDNITNDNTPTMSVVADAGTVVRLYANCVLIAEAAGGGTVLITTSELAEGVYSFKASSEDSAGNRSEESATLVIEIDTTPPAAPALLLHPDSDTDPDGDQHTDEPLVNVIGTTSPNIQVMLVELSRTTNSDANGNFEFPGVPLSLGSNTFTTEIEDAAGNAGQLATTITRDPLAGSILLDESTGFVSEYSQTIALGHASGTRKLRFEVEATFDESDQSAALEDALLIYLVDPSAPAETLLDRGTNGTAVFMLAGSQVEFAPGLVTFDGNTVEIDLTSLGSLSAGQLVFQLINSDADNGTRVMINSLTNTVDAHGTATVGVDVDDYLAVRGGPLDLGLLSDSSDVSAVINNVRFDSDSGLYTAELRLRNDGEAIGRRTAVLFEDLPAGVTLNDPSGVDGSGAPYINMTSAIVHGGLAHAATSDGIQIEFADPTLLAFSIHPRILVGPPNQAPLFPPITSATVRPGEHLAIDLNVSDPDDDPITIHVRAEDGVYFGGVAGELFRVSPTPSDIGTYDLILTASDGILETSQSLTVVVEADPGTTTRFSGFVLDVNGSPLPGMHVEIGAVQGLTQADGSFTLDLGSGPVAGDTLKIRGELYGQSHPGAPVYPFIAEKLAFILDHDVYLGVNNVISRPIFLPALDVANGKDIDPMVDTVVTTAAIPGASVFVEAGTLYSQQGTPFDGVLHITEVPRHLTPAALPLSALPDIVVTIQPGEMVFAQQAPLTLPNRAGYPAGQLFKLMSINPVTGEFDNVGTGAVVGNTIQTTSGGIRNSSWHYFEPLPEAAVDPNEIVQNEDEGCEDDCKALVETGSQVELHSGAYVEYHDLAGYQSQGQTRSWQLTYDSNRVNPQPIVHFAYDNVQAATDRRLGATLSWPGAPLMLLPTTPEGAIVGPRFQHYWSVPSSGNIEAALQADLRHLWSGKHTLTLNSGLVQYVGGQEFGTTTEAKIDVTIVNYTGSAFGAGWGLRGVTDIVQNADRSVLLIDGDGSELLFKNVLGHYLSPAGDFSTLEVVNFGDDVVFQRTFPDQSVDRYRNVYRSPNQIGTGPSFLSQIATRTDRNGNVTQFEYNAQNRLSKIVDPVGLETVFQYTNNKVSSIVHPGNRVTQLEYDSAGNLTRIIDPDETARQFEYNENHKMTAEVTKRGFREGIQYDSFGRVTKTVRRDGAEFVITPLQTQQMIRYTLTTQAASPPSVNYRSGKVAALESAAFFDADFSSFGAAHYLDGNGQLFHHVVDRAGQLVSLIDGIGHVSTRDRNAQNRVEHFVSGRGFETFFVNDSLGNLLSAEDDASFGATTEMRGEYTFQDELNESSGGPDLFTVDGVGQFVSDTVFEEQREVYAFGAGVGLGVDTTGLLTHDDFSIELVFSLDDVVGRQRIIDFTDQNFDGFGTGLNVTDGQLEFGYGSGALNNRGGTITAGQYVHVVLTRSAATGAVAGYVNGEKAFQFTDIFNRVKINNFHEFLKFFVKNRSPFNFGDVASGRVAFIRLYDKPLRPGQANSLSSDPFGINFTGPGKTVFTYDPVFQRRTSMTDELGRQILYAIDPANGNLLSETRVVGQVDPSGGETDDVVTSYTYTASGLVDTMTDPLGRVTDFGYDAFDRLISTTYALGTSDEATATYEYNLAGNQSAVNDENGNRTEFEYDALNRLIRIVQADPDGIGPETSPIVEFAYDAAGNQIEILDPLLHATKNVFDPLDRRVSAVDALGQITQFTYDSSDNLLSNVDRLGRQTRYVYDSRNRVVETIDPLGFSERKVFDLDNNVVAMIDKNGNATHFKYDVRNRLSQTTDARQGVIRQRFDQVNNVVRQSDELNRRTEYVYDELNRLSQRIDPDPDGPLIAGTGGLSASYAFDGSLSEDSTGPDLAVVGSTGQFVSRTVFGETRNVYRFAQGDGLQLTTTSVIPDDEYTIEMVFSVDQVSAFRRVLNFLSPTADHGLYVQNGTLAFYPVASGGTVLASQFVHLALTRNAATNQVRAYVNGVLAFSFTDSGGLAKINPSSNPSDHLLFFIDDGAEESAGEIALLRFYSVPLDATQVQTLAADPFGATPPSGTGPTGVQESPVTQYQFDKASNLRFVTDPLGNVSEFIYDERNRMVQQIDPDPDDAGPLSSPVTHLVYDDGGRLISVRDPLDHETTYGYDALNRRTHVTEPDPDGAAGPELAPEWTIVYDAIGNELSATDPLGNVTNYEYDALYRRTKVIQPDPDGAGPDSRPVTSFAYDQAGQLLFDTDPLNRTTNYQYDLLGRRIELTLPDPDLGGPLASPVIRYAFDAVGNLIAQTDALGNVTEKEYDQLHRLIQLTEADPDGSGPALNPITLYEYDAADQLLSVTDPMNRVTRYSYDDLGRTVVVVEPDPDGAGPLEAPESTATYDLVGNKLSMTDPLGHTSEYEYDNLYRLMRRLDADLDDAGPLGQPETIWSYDSASNLLSLTDPAGYTTTYKYDGLNRRILEEIDLGSEGIKTRAFQFDPVGHLIRSTDRNGRTIQFTFDNLYRRVEENWLDDQDDIVHTMQYSFDLANQLLSADDVTVGIRYDFQYDALGRLTETLVDNLGVAGQFDASYNATNQRTGLSATIATVPEFQNVYRYDGLLRQTSVEQAGQLGGNVVSSKRVDFDYDADSQLHEVRRYKSLLANPLDEVATSTFDYDGLGRLEGLNHSQSSTVLHAFDFDYDISSRITRIHSSIDGTSSFNYDGINQLTAADHSSQTDENYVFDENGNRTGGGYLTGAYNRLLSDGVYSYDYDAEGNRTKRTEIASGNITEYEWDYRNRLVRVIERASAGGPASSVVDQYYDTFNRWMGRDWDSDGDGPQPTTSTRFFLDGSNIVLATDELGTVQHRYLWGPAVDQILADENGTGDVLFPLTNHQGTVTDLVDSEGSVVSRRAYNAFGKITSETAAVDHLFGFTGRPFDEATDLQNNLNRWYDADTGRWLSEDPISFSGGDENLYRYAGNDVLRFTDPDGLYFGEGAIQYAGAAARQAPGAIGRAGIKVGELGLNVGLFVDMVAADVYGHAANFYGLPGGDAALQVADDIWAAKFDGINTAGQAGLDLYHMNKAQRDKVLQGAWDDLLDAMKKAWCEHQRLVDEGRYDEAARMLVDPLAEAVVDLVFGGAASAKKLDKLKDLLPSGKMIKEKVKEFITSERGSWPVGRGVPDKGPLSGTSVAPRPTAGVIDDTTTVSQRAYRSGPRMPDSQLLRRNTNTTDSQPLTEWRRSISRSNLRTERIKFVGEDAVKIDAGTWRSLDGTRQFRTVPSDYLGRHGIGQPTVPNIPHVHFEFLAPPNPGGSNLRVLKNVHVPLVD